MLSLIKLNTIHITFSGNVLPGGEAVTTPTFQLGSTGSTPGGDIFPKTPENVC